MSYYIDKKSVNFTSEDNDLKIFLGKDENDDNICIKNNGIFQNILITGSIGSGKTSSAISNIVLELVKKNILGLIIDVKGNYVQNLKSIISKNNISVNVVEISLDNDFKYNPIDKPNKSSIEIASELKLVLTLLSDTKNSDSYWLDKVESFLSDFITIIRAKGLIVNFYEIHRLVNEKEYLLDSINHIKEKILKNQFKDDELFNINAAILNIKNEFLKLDDRTIGIIKSEITRITSIFVSDNLLYKKFCRKSDDIDFYNNIYVLSINIGENRKLLKIIATYLKLDFQKQILSKIYFKKEVFFICDEYQEIANVEDAHFFSLSREYKCINVISMQSYSSLLNTLNNEYATRVIIQNLVNKIWFRNDDLYTVNEIIKQIGKEIKDLKTTNYSENAQNTSFSIMTNHFKNDRSSIAKGISFSEKDEYIFNENYFTMVLETFQAVLLISDGKNMKLYKKGYLKRLE
ncbi:MAG: type IV secretion system DNA-binding domain-containing protein [Clostridia bacterium]|nr:type IV secretion system DNA-binding domain-containing protein [Clostridia bacterium]